MDRIPSLEDAVISMVREFMDSIEEANPFDTHLMEFRLKLRAKLLEIYTSFPTDPEVANRSLSYAVEGIGEVLKEKMNGIDLDSDESIYRTVKTLETINDIIKEFMYSDSIKDKKALSSVSGYIAGTVENLRREYRRRFSGIKDRIKRILGMSRGL